MKRGIFGGTFNPPHAGHLIVGERVREQFGLDVVTFIPTFVPPHKAPDGITEARHRLEMVRIAIGGNPHFEVSSMEIDRGGVSYTVETLSALKEKFPEDLLYLLIGMDNLVEFDSWREPERITRLAEVVVMTRPGVSRPSSAHRMTVAEVPAIDISSTDIRERVARGASIRYQVPDAVAAYIAEHQLYR